MDIFGTEYELAQKGSENNTAVDMLVIETKIENFNWRN